MVVIWKGSTLVWVMLNSARIILTIFEQCFPTITVNWYTVVAKTLYHHRYAFFTDCQMSPMFNWWHLGKCHVKLSCLHQLIVNFHLTLNHPNVCILSQILPFSVPRYWCGTVRNIKGCEKNTYRKQNQLAFLLNLANLLVLFVNIVHFCKYKLFGGFFISVIIVALVENSLSTSALAADIAKYWRAIMLRAGNRR